MTAPLSEMSKDWLVSEILRQRGEINRIATHVIVVDANLVQRDEQIQKALVILREMEDADYGVGSVIQALEGK